VLDGKITVEAADVALVPGLDLGARRQRADVVDLPGQLAGARVRRLDLSFRARSAGAIRETPQRLLVVVV
jgi:hypothetical protein